MPERFSGGPARDVTNLSYLAEMRITRKIESNDGRRIVELRRFHQARNAKLLCDVESITIELGLPGQVLLGVLDAVEPGSTESVLVAKPLIEAILSITAQPVANASVTKAFAHVDTLAGKTVRITYVDGTGVEELVPVGCTLSESERDFIFATAVLSDCYIFPELNFEPGKSWSVDGSQRMCLIDPSFRGIPEGSVQVERTEDRTDAGKRYAGRRIRLTSQPPWSERSKRSAS